MLDKITKNKFNKILNYFAKLKISLTLRAFSKSKIAEEANSDVEWDDEKHWIRQQAIPAVETLPILHPIFNLKLRKIQFNLKKFRKITGKIKAIDSKVNMAVPKKSGIVSKLEGNQATS